MDTDNVQSPAEQQPTAPGRKDFLALFSAVMLPMFLAAVDQTLLATATPRIAADLGGLRDTSWIAVGYLMAAAVTGALYGRAGDRLGRRNALVAALGVFAAGSAACALAQSLPTLVAARVVQGLGGGGLMVLSQALIGELVPPQERARYQAYFAGLFTLSSISGPVVGGLVVSHGNWRWLFWVNVPLCAFAAWRVARLPRAQPQHLSSDQPDPVGALLFTGATVCSLLWLTFGGHRLAWLSGPSAALLAAAASLWWWLLRVERRHDSPFVPLALLRQPGLRPTVLTVVCFAVGMFALVFCLPIYLQLGHGVDASRAGLLMLPLTLGTALGAALTGRFIVRTALAGLLPRYGLALAAAALGLLALGPPALWMTALAAGFVGIGLGTVMPNAQIVIQMRAGRQRLGMAAATASMARSLGASVGTALFGSLVFALLGVQGGGAEDPGLSGRLATSNLDPAGVRHAFHITFGMMAGVLLAGAAAARRVQPLSLRPEDEETAVLKTAALAE